MSRSLQKQKVMDERSFYFYVESRAGKSAVKYVN
jgi:hypothetical protein